MGIEMDTGMGTVDGKMGSGLKPNCRRVRCVNGMELTASVVHHKSIDEN